MSKPNTVTITIFMLAALVIWLAAVEIAKAQISPESFELETRVDHPTFTPARTDTGPARTNTGPARFDEGPARKSVTEGYLANLYKWFLGFVGIAALLGIVIGGVMYMFAGANITKTDAAKTWITNAFAGILIAAFSYLLLKTINPDLIQGFNIQTVIESAIKGVR